MICTIATFWTILKHFQHSVGSHPKRIKAMLGMLSGGENLCGCIHDGAITLGLSLHEGMTKLISIRGRSTLQLEQTTELLVILTACLFSFVVGEHEMRPSCTCYHLKYHCRWKILLILRNLNKKQGINTKKYCSSCKNKAS